MPSRRIGAAKWRLGMKIFGKPVELAPGLMVMWGNRVSCEFSEKNEPEKFFTAGEQKVAAYGLDSLWYVKQEHTALGRVLTGTVEAGMHALPDEEDYLVTDMPHVGIGVMTADCLPIIFFDPVRRVVAAAHAGWKGSVQGIAVVALRVMQQRFGCNVADVQIWFGPHAKPCCYEVKPVFRENLLQAIAAQVLEQRGDQLFFNNALYNALLLRFSGVGADQINQNYALCTMCSPGFHSRRNDGPMYVGQSSIAWLKN
jgi:YfiH family protein